MKSYLLVFMEIHTFFTYSLPYWINDFKFYKFQFRFVISDPKKLQDKWFSFKIDEIKRVKKTSYFVFTLFLEILKKGSSFFHLIFFFCWKFLSLNLNVQFYRFKCGLDLFCNLLDKYWRTDLSFIVPLVSGTTMQIIQTKPAEWYLYTIYWTYVYVV